MPGWLILAIVVFVFAVISGIITLATRNTAAAGQPDTRSEDAQDAHTAFSWATGVLLVLAVLFVLVSSYNGVGTKEVGVETSFGKTAGHLSNGPHLTWPWIKVHPMDGAIQTDNYDGSSGHCTASTCSDPIEVRMANQQLGYAHVSFQWRIRPEAVDALYQNYRSFDHVRSALVTRQLGQAVNEAMANYNPLENISAGQSVSAGLPAIAARVTALMKSKIGGRIEVLSTTLPIVTFDDSTQKRINQLQQQDALTRVATEQEQTNRAQAAANSALAKSSLTPLVLESRCLDILSEMIKEDQAIPPGMGCIPGTSNLSGVIASQASSGK